MRIAGYEIPSRLVAIGGLVLAVAVIVVVLVVVKPFSSSPSSSLSQPSTANNTPVTGKGITQIKGSKFIISMTGPATVLGGGYSAFATLTTKNQTIWTHRLTSALVGSALPDGDYVLSVAFSPCKLKSQPKADCSVFHGGVGIPPKSLKGGQDVKIVVHPKCVKVKFGAGVDCSKTTVEIS
jgi:hypothetical protein